MDHQKEDEYVEATKGEKVLDAGVKENPSFSHEAKTPPQEKQESENHLYKDDD
jgi:hypothetical protein